MDTVRLVSTDAHEGPVYVPGEDALYFTSLPAGGRSAIKRLDLASGEVEVFVPHANGANGMTLDRDGRLLVCEQGSRFTPARITRMDRSTRERTTVVDNWAGLPLNSPNDVAVARDGAVWFTDPSYGYLQGFRPQPQVGDFVYRHDPATGRTDVVADNFNKPNGIAFSPDERTLYVTDSGANQTPGSFHPEMPHHVMAFDVLDGRRLGPGRLFAVISPGFPDGLKCDAAGRVYVSSSSGVQVFAPDGDPLGQISLPGAVNFCFGGPELDRLFITNDEAVWAADLNARGASSWKPSAIAV
ncbi:MAG: SMP-30/gluconolactonase/LRE family protein [Actinomycetota bacterium]|nr:SMP-30/gluconolactonase/LRE family protein [Actinomycetota bacterium]